MWGGKLREQSCGSFGEKTKTSHASNNDWLIHQQVVVLNLLTSNLEHLRSSTPARSDPPL